jgi:hypothetical protein
MTGKSFKKQIPPPFRLPPSKRGRKIKKKSLLLLMVFPPLKKGEAAVAAEGDLL